MENKKNRDFLNIALKPSHDYGISWYCSLRQAEHDTVFDGLMKLKKAAIKKEDKK